MSIFVGQQGTMFADKEHYEFYAEKVQQLKADVYLQSLIYAVGISDTTRRNWKGLYDEKQRQIIPEGLHKPWQTGTTYKLTRLAFQLFTDGEPTATTFDENDKEVEDFAECQRYSVSDIFCCEFAPFFVEAVKIRYPDYFQPRAVYRAD